MAMKASEFNIKKHIRTHPIYKKAVTLQPKYHYFTKLIALRMRKLLLYTLSALAMTGMTAKAQNTPVSQMEKLDRGVVALTASSGSGNFVSWRFLGTDDEATTTFDLLRNGSRVKSNLYATNCVDASGNATSTYQVVTKVNGEPVDTSKAVTAWGNTYKVLKLQRPATGAQGGTYEPNDCSVGDVDGDGQYEIFVKWYPSNAKDNSQGGITDNTIIDCYRLDGTFLWRVDLGPNIRSGAHYTQFMVYDFDGDGRAEMMCKTGPGSKDGLGEYVNAAATETSIKNASGTDIYRNSDGRIIGGQEWLTVFNGLTGKAIHTVFYNPNRNMTYGGAADGSVNWGVGKTDKASYGNRGERYLAGVAHLDGPDANPSGIFCRGYYDYAFLWAVDFDGEQLHQRWLSSNKNGSSYTVTTYNAAGQGTTKTYSNMKPTSGSGSGTMYQNGNHNMSVADVDGDGRDEIVWGSATCDDDGRVLFGTGFGHGDAIHLADHCPDRPGLEVFQIHEGGNYGWDLHDAATGEILFSATGSADNGRGIAGQFDGSVRGSLFWSSNDGSARSTVTGNVVSSNHGSSNFRIFWDGNLQEELLDGTKIDKWTGSGTSRMTTLSGSTCNSTKNTPNLQADILGDWREEVILHNGSDQIIIYSTNTATNYRMPTLMHDHTYRMGICWQNTAYNQPPHLGYYLPDAMLPSMQQKEFTVNMGEETEVIVPLRYTKSVSIKASFMPDGTRKAASLGEDMTRISDTTYKTFRVKITAQQAGDYRIALALTDLDGSSTKVNDTIVIHAINTTGIEQLEQIATEPQQPELIFDLQGRRRTEMKPGEIYIIRRNGKNYKVKGE